MKPAQVAAAEAGTTTAGGRVVIPVDDDEAVFDGDAEGDVTVKGGIGLSLSNAPTGRLRDRLLRAVRSGKLAGTSISGSQRRGESSNAAAGRNVQANDSALDHVTTFDPSIVVTRPFEFATQSETSAVRNGKHVVVGYNSSAGAVVEFIPGLGLAFTRLKFSAFSVSHDGGRTFASGFLPAVNDAVAPFTFGDPALATDRRGNVFYASLGVDADGAHGTININKSTDNGSSFGSATVVAVDDGSDKEWLAIGPDPIAKFRDNIYVTWTSFQDASSELWLARSTDGGQSFTSRRLFAPVDDGVNSAFIQFSNPVVDDSTGRLFVPFLHFSNGNADNVRVLVSNDGGVTFSFLVFEVPGAIDAFAFPNVTPGLINDCTGGGFRNALVAGPDQGGGRGGAPRFAQATRLITQPHAAAAKGTFLFALNSSTSGIFGDPAAGSEINLVVSTDGGSTFSLTKVAASTHADPQHVHPAVSLSQNARDLDVSFFVQQSNQLLRTDVASFKINGDGRVRAQGIRPLSSTAFALTPSNVVRTPAATTNFDRTVVSCYDIGEYQALARSRDEGESVSAAWGDNRNRWIAPPGSAAPGTHAQPDVFTADLPDGN
ncbi:MAG TPA: sialidase family protein [Myxococcales bacterium]|nr:sialidase family protein [Myxococcales bacterium]